MGAATMTSEFESWVRTTVSGMPFFDSQKGGFIGVPALKKTLLASVPPQILDRAKSPNSTANLGAELNSIFKQGGLTQELLAECERRRKVMHAEKEGKDEKKETTMGEGQKSAKMDKPKDGQQCEKNGSTGTEGLGTIPGTGGVPIELSSNGARTNKSHDIKLGTPVQTDSPVNVAKGSEKLVLKPDQKTKVTERIFESTSAASGSVSSRSPRSPTSPSHLTHEPSTPTTLDHTPPFLIGAPQVPFIVQHRLLNHLQALLEEACYHYMLREFPGVLLDKEWDCPEAAELTVWVHTITKVLTNSNQIAERDVLEITSILRRASKVRHCAVHRKAVSTVHLWILLDSAEAALRFLGDGEKEKEVVNLRHLVENESRDLVFKLEKGERQLSEELEELDRFREELARREAAARSRQEELETRAKSYMAANLAELLDQAINKKGQTSSTLGSSTRVGAESPNMTDYPTSRRLTTEKRTQRTESVEEFKKFGLKPLRPPPSSACQFNLTKLTVSARQASAQKTSPKPLDITSETGTASRTPYWDASETLVRKAVLEDDPGYSSEEGGTQLHS